MIHLNTLLGLANRFEKRAQIMYRDWCATRADTAASEALRQDSELLNGIASDLRATVNELLGLTSDSTAPYRGGMSIDDLKGTANLLRAKIKDVADDVKRFKDNDVSGALAAYSGSDIDKGEVIANVQIAYRHLEDARHRLYDCLYALGGAEPKSPPQQQA